MPRTSNTQARREQIALALMQVMAHKGYDGASIQDIGRAAGLAPGLVHYHFTNKQEILLALLDLLVARQDARLETRLEGKVGLEALDGFIEAHLAVGADADPEALACWIALGAEALRQPEVGQAFGQALVRLRDRLLAILRELPCADPAAAAAAILSAVQGYFLVAGTARVLIPRGSAAGQMKAMAHTLLTAPTKNPSRKAQPHRCGAKKGPVV